MTHRILPRMSRWMLLVAALALSCSRKPTADEVTPEPPAPKAKKATPSADLPDQEELAAIAGSAGQPTAPVSGEVGGAVAAKTRGPVKACFLEEMGRTKGASGAMLLRVVVDKTGKVSKAELTENAFSKAFEACVVTAVGKLAFAPSTQEQTVQIPYKFNVK